MSPWFFNPSLNPNLASVLADSPDWFQIIYMALILAPLVVGSIFTGWISYLIVTHKF